MNMLTVPIPLLSLTPPACARARARRHAAHAGCAGIPGPHRIAQHHPSWTANTQRRHFNYRRDNRGGGRGAVEGGVGNGECARTSRQGSNVEVGRGAMPSRALRAQLVHGRPYSSRKASALPPRSAVSGEDRLPPSAARGPRGGRGARRRCWLLTLTITLTPRSARERRGRADATAGPPPATHHRRRRRRPRPARPAARARFVG